MSGAARGVRYAERKKSFTWHVIYKSRSGTCLLWLRPMGTDKCKTRFLWCNFSPKHSQRRRLPWRVDFFFKNALRRVVIWFQVSGWLEGNMFLFFTSDARVKALGTLCFMLHYLWRCIPTMSCAPYCTCMAPKIGRKQGKKKHPGYEVHAVSSSARSSNTGASAL